MQNYFHERILFLIHVCHFVKNAEMFLCLIVKTIENIDIVTVIVSNCLTEHIVNLFCFL